MMSVRGALGAALALACLASAAQARFVATPIDLYQAAVIDGAPHIVITSHINFDALETSFIAADVALSGGDARTLRVHPNVQSIRGSCAPRSGTPVALKPRQCVITASADLFDLSQVRSMWMHNMYLESARDTETSWSRNTLLSTNGTTLYLTHTTFQGAGLDEYDGASFENGLLMDQSRLYAYGVVWADFLAPNGYALAIGHGTTAALRESSFTHNRAAVFLPSDDDLVATRERDYASVADLAAGSTVTSRLSLQNTIFEGSGEWSAAEAYRGGGDVAAYDYPRVFSDRDFIVPHVCGTRNCFGDMHDMPTLPLACGSSGFLTGAEAEFAELQQAAEAAHPGRPSIALAPQDLGEQPPAEACESKWAEPLPAPVRQMSYDTSKKIVLWIMVGILVVCFAAFVAPVTRACVICWVDCCRKREEPEEDPAKGGPGPPRQRVRRKRRGPQSSKASSPRIGAGSEASGVVPSGVASTCPSSPAVMNAPPTAQMV